MTNDPATSSLNPLLNPDAVANLSKHIADTVINRRGIPKYALLTIGGVALLEAALAGLTHGAFDMLVDFVSPVYWFFLVLSGLAVIVLRVRYPHAPRPFRVPLYPVLPLLFGATSAYVLYATLAYVKVGALAGIAVLAFGVLLLPWFGRVTLQPTP